MKDNLSKAQTNAVLQALDDAIAKGPWDESNFLRVIGKNLQEIRERLASEVAKNTLTVGSNRLDSRNRRQQGFQEVYIALYSSEGNQLQSWERILANLQRQMISRPIYSDEENVRSLIKTKENKLNEAYVAIDINPADILVMNSDKIMYDKLGKPLLNLKDRSLNLDHVNRFVHMSNTYTYVKGRLVKQD